MSDPSAFISLRFIARRAETDETLSQSDCNNLRYGTSSAHQSPSAAVVEKLLIYEKLLENLIERDKEIEEQDEKVIRNIMDDTDSDQQNQFNFATMRTHLLEILSRFFSRDRVMNSE